MKRRNHILVLGITLIQAFSVSIQSHAKETESGREQAALGAVELLGGGYVGKKLFFGSAAEGEAPLLETGSQSLKAAQLRGAEAAGHRMEEGIDEAYLLSKVGKPAKKALVPMARVAGAAPAAVGEVGLLGVAFTALPAIPFIMTDGAFRIGVCDTEGSFLGNTKCDKSLLRSIGEKVSHAAAVFTDGLAKILPSAAAPTTGLPQEKAPSQALGAK